MSKATHEVPVVRNYRDTVFRKLFSSKSSLLSLYNAVNETHYENPDDLEIVTLDNAVYMSMKNDLAFLIDFQLHLYEHQSTVNPNMPLRFLHYVAKEYEKLLDSSLLYRNKLIKIPAPHFVVFYNGTGKHAESEILKLSDSFQKHEDAPQLELKVRSLNINEGHNLKLMEQCQILKEYILYIGRVRLYTSTMEVRKAVSRAVDECIKEGILAEFLRKNKAEVVAMSIYEYDEEKVLAMIRKDEHEDGFVEGRLEGLAEGLATGRSEGFATGHSEGAIEGKKDAIFDLLTDLGTLPEAVEQKIRSEKDTAILSKWLKLAARSESIVQFIENLNQ